MTCKCAKRIARLEHDVTRLRAQLPKEIHHAARFELKAALADHEKTFAHAPKGGYLIPNYLQPKFGLGTE